MKHSSARPGYVFLLTVLSIGVIATATVLSLLLLGWAAQQNGRTLAESAQARFLAQTCIERALLTLRESPSYAGGETISFSKGDCELETIGGSGNVDRTICAEGRSGRSVRRLELAVDLLVPTTSVSSFREVVSFSLCP